MLCSMCQHGTTTAVRCKTCGDTTCAHVQCKCRQIPYRKLMDAFVCVLDGNSAWHEIQANTGCEREQCEEISRIFNIMMRG
jgi:hypothetical protein